MWFFNLNVDPTEQNNLVKSETWFWDFVDCSILNPIYFKSRHFPKAEALAFNLKKMSLGKFLANVYRHTYRQRTVDLYQKYFGHRTELPDPFANSHSFSEFKEVSRMSQAEFEALETVWNDMLLSDLEQATPLWPAAIEFPIPIDSPSSSKSETAEFVYWAN